jgi:hypothetical protein
MSPLAPTEKTPGTLLRVTVGDLATASTIVELLAKIPTASVTVTLTKDVPTPVGTQARLGESFDEQPTGRWLHAKWKPGVPAMTTAARLTTCPASRRVRLAEALIVGSPWIVRVVADWTE